MTASLPFAPAGRKTTLLRERRERGEGEEYLQADELTGLEASLPVRRLPSDRDAAPGALECSEPCQLGPSVRKDEQVQH